MASYSRLGNYLLATELGADLFGKIHRGLTFTGTGFDFHVLIRTFSQEILDAGIASKADEIQKAISMFSGQRNFSPGYRMEGGRTPHLVSEYQAGRSLTTLLEKAKQEQLPLNVDHALNILQGVAQTLIQMHTKGLRHGVLSPASVWVSFEGATHLLDAPFAATVCSLLPRCRNLTAGLARYRGPMGTNPFQQDLFALGTILFELLTLEKIPSLELLNSSLSRATLKAAQEDGPIPEDVMNLLRRLLGVGGTFENPTALNAELERVLYEGSYTPTTFNMAFFMHTLFREENEADLDAIKEDKEADFTPFLEMEPHHRSLFETESGKNYAKYVYVGGSLLIALASYFGVRAYRSEMETKALQEKIDRLREQSRESDSQVRELSRQEADANRKMEERTQALKRAKSEKERQQIRQEQEEAEQRLARILREKQKALQNQREIELTARELEKKVERRTEKPPEAEKPVRAAIKPIDPPKKPEINPTLQPTPSHGTKLTQPETTQPEIPRLIATPQPPVAPPVEPVEQENTTIVPASILHKSTPVVSRVPNINFLPPNIRSSDIKVTVEVFVDSSGRPQKASVKQGISGNFPYNDAARQAALNSTYAAATKNGQGVNSTLTVEYNFGRAK